eukprot:g48243.t1
MSAQFGRRHSSKSMVLRVCFSVFFWSLVGELSSAMQWTAAASADMRWLFLLLLSTSCFLFLASLVQYFRIRTFTAFMSTQQQKQKGVPSCVRNHLLIAFLTLCLGFLTLCLGCNSLWHSVGLNTDYWWLLLFTEPQALLFRLLAFTSVEWLGVVSLNKNKLAKLKTGMNILFTGCILFFFLMVIITATDVVAAGTIFAVSAFALSLICVLTGKLFNHSAVVLVAEISRAAGARGEAPNGSRSSCASLCGVMREVVGPHELGARVWLVRAVVCTNVLVQSAVWLCVGVLLLTFGWSNLVFALLSLVIVTDQLIIGAVAFLYEHSVRKYRFLSRHPWVMTHSQGSRLQHLSRVSVTESRLNQMAGGTVKVNPNAPLDAPLERARSPSHSLGNSARGTPSRTLPCPTAEGLANLGIVLQQQDTSALTDATEMSTSGRARTLSGLELENLRLSAAPFPRQSSMADAEGNLKAEHEGADMNHVKAVAEALIHSSLHQHTRRLSTTSETPTEACLSPPPDIDAEGNLKAEHEAADSNHIKAVAEALFHSSVQ